METRPNYWPLDNPSRSVRITSGVALGWGAVSWLVQPDSLGLVSPGWASAWGARGLALCPGVVSVCEGGDPVGSWCGRVWGARVACRRDRIWAVAWASVADVAKGFFWRGFRERVRPGRDLGAWWVSWCRPSSAWALRFFMGVRWVSECERSVTRGRPASLDGSRGSGFFLTGGLSLVSCV